jgi:hypothetical protein
VVSKKLFRDLQFCAKDGQGYNLFVNDVRSLVIALEGSVGVCQECGEEEKLCDGSCKGPSKL